ncbi:MAG: type II secretion system F family protein [Planctomycetes bacterium]|nr:type II secretion system F family protein [Planctomycetota bacterium]
MPTYHFEAMDSTGTEIKDVIEAATQEEAQQTIRQRGYFVTKIAVKKTRKDAKAKAGGPGKKKSRGLVIGGVSGKQLTTFTRQLSILQDAGLPILRSLRILEQQSKPGRLKNSLLDVCEEIESGSTLSEAMSKCPKAFNRLFVNMIRAGEAGGALEVILQRLAEFQERADALKRKVRGAMVYPCVVVAVAVIILTCIMIWIVPSFEKIFRDFKLDLPLMTRILITVSTATLSFWYLIPLIPISIWLMVKLVRKFEMGRTGWDGFIIKFPVFGQLIEKNILARTTRTLGTLVASGVPILEAMNIVKETSGNAIFERLFGKVTESIREGESISKPMKEYSTLVFNPICAFFWFFFILGPIGLLLYMKKMREKVIDDLVVNMVDVGEETGELDTMLYKVADTYDDEVKVLTETLVSLMEPLLIVGLGLMIGFIVISLFLPLISLINSLT